MMMLTTTREIDRLVCVTEALTKFASTFPNLYNINFEYGELRVQNGDLHDIDRTGTMYYLSVDSRPEVEAVVTDWSVQWYNNSLSAHCYATAPLVSTSGVKYGHLVIPVFSGGGLNLVADQWRDPASPLNRAICHLPEDFKLSLRRRLARYLQVRRRQAETRIKQLEAELIRARLEGGKGL